MHNVNPHKAFRLTNVGRKVISLTWEEESRNIQTYMSSEQKTTDSFCKKKIKNLNKLLHSHGVEPDLSLKCCGFSLSFPSWERKGRGVTRRQGQTGHDPKLPSALQHKHGTSSGMLTVDHFT